MFNDVSLNLSRPSEIIVEALASLRTDLKSRAESMVNTIQPVFKDCLMSAASNLPVNGTLIENVEKCASPATTPTAPATSETITEENAL